MPKDVEKIANKELGRLQKIPSHSPEYTVSRTYLDWLVGFGAFNQWTMKRLIMQ